MVRRGAQFKIACTGLADDGRPLILERGHGTFHGELCAMHADILHRSCARQIADRDCGRQVDRKPVGLAAIRRQRFRGSCGLFRRSNDRLWSR
jgi:hypothetical protein